MGDKDVYNITAPFVIQNERVIAGRVESRDSEESEIHFFVQKEGKWKPKEDAMVFKLQDPFYTFVDGELILGGVQTFPDPEAPERLKWRTVFYRGSSLSDLKEFFAGPDGMKDLRIVQLEDKKIGIFTRPQGDKGGEERLVLHVSIRWKIYPFRLLKMRLFWQNSLLMRNGEAVMKFMC